jgi:hypothetical protein
MKSKMNSETLSECNSDKVNHDNTLLKYSNSYISTKKIQNEFETSRECNSDKVNHDKTQLKYSNSYISRKKNLKRTLKYQENVTVNR